MSAEHMARIEDTRAGRTIPVWRYELAYWLIAVAMVVGQLVPDDTWWDLPLILGVLVAYGILIRPFRRRWLR